MKLLQFVPIKLTVFLVLGILLGYYWDPIPYWVLILCFLSVVLLGILHFTNFPGASHYYGLLAMIATIGLGIISVALNRSFTIDDQLKRFEASKTYLWGITIEEELKSSAYYKRFVGRVYSLDDKKSGGHVLCRLAIKNYQDSLQPGQQILVYARAEKIQPPLNPHQFNYKKYLEDQGIHYQIKLDPGSYKNILQESGSFIGSIVKFRDRLSKRLKSYSFGKQESGIVQALLLGNRNYISETTYDDYKDAGAIHILAVSGLHIGVVLFFLHFLLRPIELLPSGKTLKLILTVLCLWIFALLAGFSASVVRAVSMFSFVAYSLYLNRPRNTFNILALSMFFTLLFINPLYLFQVGFQLSYAAVFSIVWIYPKLIRLWTPKQVVLLKVWQLFSVGLAAQFGVLPLSLFYFHQFPGLFFISNLLIVPFLGLVLGMGFTVIITDLVWNAPSFLIDLYGGLIHKMNSLVGWIAQQESFVFKEVNFDLVHLLLTYILLITFALMLDKFRYRAILVFGCCVLGIQLWNSYLLFSTKQTHRLTIMHSIGETILFHQDGDQLIIHSRDTQNSDRMAFDFKMGENLRSTEHKTLRNTYLINNKRLLILTKDLQHLNTDLNSEMLLLSNSPKINLDRYLANHQPELVIADGSNYRSFVRRWKESCYRRKISFYDTSEQGALPVNFE